MDYEPSSSLSLTISQGKKSGKEINHHMQPHVDYA